MRNNTTSSGDHGGAGQSATHGGNRFNPIAIFALAAVVVLAAIVSGLVFIFGGGAGERTQYTVTVLLLFFALSTISALLFANSTRMEGSFLGWTVALGGPSAFWFVCVLVFFRFGPDIDPGIEVPRTLAQAGTLFRQQESRLGWITYEELRAQVDGYETIFDAGEPSLVKSLLEANFREGSEAPQLEDTVVTTLFVQARWTGSGEAPDNAPAEGFVVKLQRIRGRRLGGADRANINFRSSPTGSGEANSALLCAEPGDTGLALTGSFANVSSRGYSEAVAITTLDVDCLNVTTYEDPVDEDYLLVDMKRFAGGTPDGGHGVTHSVLAPDGELAASGVVNLGVVALGNGLRQPSLWTMMAPAFNVSGSIPLSFHATLASVDEDLAAVRAELTPWLHALDSQTNRSRITEAAAPPLRNATEWLRLHFGLADGPEASFSALLGRVLDEGNSVGYHLADARDVTVLFVRYVSD